MKKLLYIVIAAFLLFACDEDVVTRGGAQPTPSTDTLNLGTILAGNSSPTYLLKLYNRNSQDLKLTSITLRDAATSGFRMNVDGMNGSSFTDSNLLRISAGDSLFMFVEATFPSIGAGTHKHFDYVDVVCNGRTSTIVLEAECKDVKKLNAYTITSDETWDEGTEVQIYDSLVIANGATLTLANSTTVYLHDKANIVVHGTIISAGSIDHPVTIRGDRTDNMFDNLPYDNLPSQWGNIYLRKESKGNFFVNTNIHGMTDGILVESDASLINCRLKNSDGNLVTAINAEMTIENCELSNAAGSLLDLNGGSYNIVHCTLANYNFASSIKQEALRLSNRDTLNNIVAPLYKCNFVNSIIWGKKFDPDVRLDYYPTENCDSIFHYRFDHCLIHADGTDDEQFIATKWNEDPGFVLVDEKNYTFDFHLSKDSPCLGSGTTVDVKSDLDGQIRQNPPSIGCYESK